jgi:hypothetical protein
MELDGKIVDVNVIAIAEVTHNAPCVPECKVCNPEVFESNEG